LNPAQLQANVENGLDPGVGLLGHAGAHDDVERGGRRALNRGDGRRFVAKNGGNQARCGAALERLTAGDHLVDERAEREYVGARAGIPSLELFRAPCTAACRP
jgi:hypothetical protein